MQYHRHQQQHLQHHLQRTQVDDDDASFVESFENRNSANMEGAYHPHPPHHHNNNNNSRHRTASSSYVPVAHNNMDYSGMHDAAGAYQHQYGYYQQQPQDAYQHNRHNANGAGGLVNQIMNAAAANDVRHQKQGNSRSQPQWRPPAPPAEAPQLSERGRDRSKPLAVQPRKALEMCVAPNANAAGMLTLTNMRQGEAVAFKIKVTAPRRYIVKPVSGVLLPGQQAHVMVEHAAMSAVGLARVMANGHDQILVQAVAVHESCASGGRDAARALKEAWMEAERHRGRVGIGLAESTRKVVLRWDARRAPKTDTTAWESHARQADAVAGQVDASPNFTTPQRQPLLPRDEPNGASMPPSFAEARDGSLCDDEERSCTICLDAGQDALAWPCGHAGTCYRCLLAHFAHNGRRCPLCRMQVEAIERS